MTSAPATSGSPSALAQMLLDHVRGAGVVDPDRLCSDPESAVEADTTVSVDWVDPAQLPPGCSIAATYDRASSPARILISQDRGLGGLRFSLLHEYAHHLRDQVPGVLSALFKAGRGAGRLEESVCDAFASECLIPTSTRAEVFAEGVTAQGVAELIATSSASEWAVAVAAAESLRVPGYVVIMDHQAHALFAARGMGVIPVRRGTPQAGLLERAARGVACRGVERIVLGAGSSTAELSVDAVPIASGAVAVAIEGPAPGALYSARAAWSVVDDLVCEHCGVEYPALGSGCLGCGLVRCPSCRRCDCPVAPMKGEQPCQRCFILKPPADFEAGSNTCLDCS